MKMIVTAASLAVLMTVPVIAQDAVQRAQEAPAIEVVEKNSAADILGRRVGEGVAGRKRRECRQ